METRFFDGYRAQPRAASLHIAAGAVVIRDLCEMELARWTLAGLTVTVGPGHAATIRHGRGPARLVVEDAAGLAVLQGALPRRWRGVGGWKAALAVGIACLAVLAGVVDAAPALLTPLLPPAWDDALGRTAEAAALSGHRRCQEVAGQAALDGFLARLEQAAGWHGARIVVSDDGTANTFALPGNRILLPRGMIEAVSDGNELAGVLAHELGHVAHRDSTRGALRAVGLQMVAGALGWGGFGSAGMAADLANLSFSRTAEREADAFAVTTLRNAGLRADGLGRFLSHAEQEPQVPTFLSDHPASAERQRLVEAGPEGEPAFDATGWRAIRSMCHGGDTQPM